ncbi:MAG: hypothetical protein V6Z86_07205 [Hyphomicrobiales bacterium]
MEPDSGFTEEKGGSRPGFSKYSFSLDYTSSNGLGFDKRTGLTLTDHAGNVIDSPALYRATSSNEKLNGTERTDYF